MFFDEPTKAFTAIESLLRPGGRLVFACWQSVERNPWHTGIVLRDLLPGPPTPAPGKSPVGPFAFGDDEYVGEILEAAGFTGVQADQAAVTVLTFVLGHALGAAAEASLTRKLGQDGGDGAALLRDRMAEAHEIAARFPRLRARLDTAAAGYGASPEDSFEFGLEAILDGLQAKLASRR